MLMLRYIFKQLSKRIQLLCKEELDMCKEELNNLNQVDEIMDVEKVEVKEATREEKLREYEDLLGF